MRIAFTLLFLLPTLTLSAQYAKGEWYLSGNTMASAEFNRVSDINFDQISVVTALIGTFVSDNFLLGLNVGYFNFGGNPLLMGDNSQFIISPLARYYFSAFRLPATLYAEAGLGAVNTGFGGSPFRADAQFGFGAERVVAPGVVATARLLYFARNDLQNTFSGVLGFNLLPGRFEKPTEVLPLTRGTISRRRRWVLSTVSGNPKSSAGISSCNSTRRWVFSSGTA